jgi:dTDP-4-dehydrorhamnose reductase
MKALQIWGNVEHELDSKCSTFVNDNDLKTVQILCSWEAVAPKDLDRCDWSTLDVKLQRLNSSDHEVIVNFLYHGSGPQYTSLIDPDFPEKFSTFARLFAQRYPWINNYSPIYDIQKTARFSYLNSDKYSQVQSNTYYLKAIIHQCKGTILAMREIRSINPAARLIQAEDIGHWQSTNELTSQRDFENERRWLALDLLCGNITSNHPLFSYIIDSRIRTEELMWFQDNSKSPDIIGINHSINSPKYIDHQIELYSGEEIKDIKKEKYVEVAAFQSGQSEMISPEYIFQEVWERYKKPLAITECYLAGKREDQMRWLYEIWQTALRLREKHIPVEAIASPAFTGASEESHTQENDSFYHKARSFGSGHNDKKYFETGLSKLVWELSSKGYSNSPVLLSEGTWKTPRGVLWASKTGDFSRLYHHSEARPIIIIKSNSPISTELAKACGSRNLFYRMMGFKEISITDADSIENVIDIYKPWAIINTDQDNLQAAGTLAKVCSDKKVQLVNFFSEGAYYEKFNEQNILQTLANTLIIKIKTHAPMEQHVSPKYLSDLANECLTLLIDEVAGLAHLAGMGETYPNRKHSLVPETNQHQVYQ